VPFIGAEGEGSDRAVEGNGRRRWSAMMVVEAAVLGGIDRGGMRGGGAPPISGVEGGGAPGGGSAREPAARGGR
jgi:hypothetical protein